MESLKKLWADKNRVLRTFVQSLESFIVISVCTVLVVILTGFDYSSLENPYVDVLVAGGAQVIVATTISAYMNRKKVEQEQELKRLEDIIEEDLKTGGTDA